MYPALRGLALLTTFALLLAPQSWAQGDKDGIGKPGAEHKILAGLEGTFETKVKIHFDPSKPADESTGLMQRKMIMGGRFLQERFEGKFLGQEFFGMGVTGFDQAKKKYTAVWVDSMTTSIESSMGTYDPATKTFTYVSESRRAASVLTPPSRHHLPHWR